MSDNLCHDKNITIMQKFYASVSLLSIFFLFLIHLKISICSMESKHFDFFEVISM